MSSTQAVTVERVESASEELVRGLAELMVDAIDGGAGVSFMAGLTVDEAVSWWRGTVRDAPPRAVILVARDAKGILGTVQLQPAWAPNQPHRADIAKLMVHSRGRRRGIARMLMEEIERFAQDGGFTLLVLDTCKGTAAEKFYAANGWTRVGVVPNFALNPDGSSCDTVFFYKAL